MNEEIVTDEKTHVKNENCLSKNSSQKNDELNKGDWGKLFDQKPQFKQPNGFEGLDKNNWGEFLEKTETLNSIMDI